MIGIFLKFWTHSVREIQWVLFWTNFLILLLVSGLEQLNTEHVSETARAGITFWNLIQNKLHKLVRYWPTLTGMEKEIMRRLKDFEEYKCC